jgi:hypothetical protein
MSRVITWVELRGLEPLTFSLRRQSVDLIGRERGVIDVQVAVAGAGCTPGAHMGYTAKARHLPRRCHLRLGPAVGIPRLSTALSDCPSRGGSGTKPRRSWLDEPHLRIPRGVTAVLSRRAVGAGRSPTHRIHADDLPFGGDLPGGGRKRGADLDREGEEILMSGEPL